MPAYSEAEQRVLRYLERKLHERRNSPTKAKQGVEKIEIARDCGLSDDEYSATIGRLEADGFVSTTARNASGEFVNVDDSIIEVARGLGIPSPNVVDTNFRLDEFINSGLYGVVWKATQLIPARRVAIKLVNPEYGMTFNAAEHAQGLVKAGRHPNIVDVYQVTNVVHPETKLVAEAVVMEWLEGECLGDRLGKSPLIEADVAKSICDGILSGIEHLHSNGVTHSDFHVGNVILTQHGPRIIDIDYSSARSLARITTIARGMRITTDVIQTAQIIELLISKSAIDRNGQLDMLQTLQRATSLGEIREVVTKIFDHPQTLAQARHDASAAPATSAASPPVVNIVDEVETAIENHRKVTLRRLVMSSTNAVVTELAGEKFEASGEVNKESLRSRVASYRSVVGPLLPTLASLGYWGGKVPVALAVEVIDRIANAHEKNPLENGAAAFLALRRYPVIAAIYAAGIGAVAGDNYGGMLGVLRDTVFYEHGRNKQRLWTEIAYWTGEQRSLWNHILGRDMYFPVSQVLEADLREALAETIPSDMRYMDTFDRFELFASLDHFLFNGRALGASFMWRRQRVSSQEDLLTDLRREAESNGLAWPPLKAGLLKGTKWTNSLAALDSFRESVQEVKASWHM